MTLPLGVLVSGRGTNLQAILDAIAAGRLDVRVVLVASNRAGVPALERAERAGIPHAVFPEATGAAPGVTDRLGAALAGSGHSSRTAAHAAMADALRTAGARLVVLAGFDRILADVFFERLEGTPVINIHPALLPAFGGRGMLGMKVHEAVLASGAAESGVTVHLAGPGRVDEGEIVVQRKVPVLPGDTPARLAARVLEQEHEALIEAIARFVPAPAR